VIVERMKAARLRLKMVPPRERMNCLCSRFTNKSLLAYPIPDGSAALHLLHL
jgi:hypothetical protein